MTIKSKVYKQSRDALALIGISLCLLVTLGMLTAHPPEIVTRSGSLLLLGSLIAMSVLSGLCLVASTILLLCDDKPTSTWLATIVAAILVGLLGGLMHYAFGLGWALVLMLEH